MSGELPNGFLELKLLLYREDDSCSSTHVLSETGLRPGAWNGAIGDLRPNEVLKHAHARVSEYGLKIESLFSLIEKDGLQSSLSITATKDGKMHETHSFAPYNGFVSDALDVSLCQNIAGIHRVVICAAFFYTPVLPAFLAIQLEE